MKTAFRRLKSPIKKTQQNMRNITFMEQKTENNHKESITGMMDMAETSGDSKERRIKVGAISIGHTQVSL